MQGVQAVPERLIGVRMRWPWRSSVKLTEACSARAATSLGFARPRSTATRGSLTRR
jgi:hypothetical protein